MFRALIALSLIFSSFAVPAHSDTGVGGDVLLGKMAGDWVGEGERVQTASGRRIGIAARVTGTIQGDRLESHNLITETQSGGTALEYVRDYWVRPSPEIAPGAYEFGTGTEVTSQGRFVDGILLVEQSLGGGPAYVIRSRTQFGQQESFYEETVRQGGRELSRTSIHYRLR